jgi:putative endonuclease
MNFIEKIYNKILTGRKKSLPNSEKSSRAIGKKGEEIALKFLWNNGYRIIAKNVLFDKGEIDIIALKDDVLCFVEVKTRKLFSQDTPDDTVDDRKRKAIINASKTFLKIHNLENYAVRVDLVNVLEEKENKYSCQLLEDIISLNN